MSKSSEDVLAAIAKLTLELPVSERAAVRAALGSSGDGSGVVFPPAVLLPSPVSGSLVLGNRVGAQFYTPKASARVPSPVARWELLAGPYYGDQGAANPREYSYHAKNPMKTLNVSRPLGERDEFVADVTRIRDYLSGVIEAVVGAELVKERKPRARKS